MVLRKNDILKKIIAYLENRNWSLYRLAKESGITYSSIHSMFEKNTQPTIPTLEKICDGLSISMAEFFSDTMTSKTFPIYTEEEEELLNLYRKLSQQDKKLILAILKRVSV